MNRSLVVLGIFLAGAFLVPHDAVAQRGGFAFRGGAPSFRSGGGGMMFRPPMGGFPRAGMGVGMAGPRGFGSPIMAGRPVFRGGAVGIAPGGFRPAIAGPGFGGYGRVAGIGRPLYRGGYYGRGYPYYGGYYGRGYPYYGGYYRRGWGYPYYGGALLAGLSLGALSYPYYDYGYSDPYLYSDATYGSDCYWVRRRVVDPWGRVVRRLVQVCEY